MEKYNNWTILEYCEKIKNERRKVICKCECGNIRKLELKRIKSGRSKGCSSTCGRKKPELTIESVIEKYNELKSIGLTAKYFIIRHTTISKILKDNNIQLYAGSRKDPEQVRKNLVKKVVEYRKRRMSRDPLYKAIIRIRSLIGQVFIKKNYTKKSKCFDILGIDSNGFKLYIESKFKEGMSWENYGEWEYDHIIPVSTSKNEEDLIKLNHYTNFQPLWKIENKIKSNKVH